MSVQGIQPYNKAVAVTPSDTVNLDGSTYSASPFTKPIPCDALIAQVAGNVVVIAENGAASTLGIAAGIVLPFKAIRVNTTNTTATGLYALYLV